MWWGNVMGDMLSRQSACFLMLSSSPTLPPMRKVICVLPCTPKSMIRRLSSSLEQGLPSMHRATSAPPQKVTVLCVGKLKEKFYLEAAAEYAKRLQRLCRLEIIELPESRLPAIW